MDITTSTQIRIAIVGLGNCAASLLQGIHYYRNNQNKSGSGLIHWEIGGYQPFDIEICAAFDIDKRKVGKDVTEAIFAPPNCTFPFCRDLPRMNVRVRMGRILDSFSEHLKEYDEAERLVLCDEPEASKLDIVNELKKSGTEILLNYLPVGSELATQFYTECALEAGVGLVNNIPVFIASDPVWAAKFEARNLPLVGDDVKSQVGATIVHRTLARLFSERGVNLQRTYQLNTGGNTDFLNMLDRRRLSKKRQSKTESVQSVLTKSLESGNIHISPSDYVPWQKDNKVCFIRMEGTIFGNAPMNLELRLSVEDSPNSSGVVIDAIRCCKLALDRGQGGVLLSPSAAYMKHPPEQLADEQAITRVHEFIEGKRKL